MRFFLLLLVFLPFFSTAGMAQISFTADPYRIEVTKPSNVDFFYDKSVLTNLSGNDMDMRWVIIETTLENLANGTVANPAGNWTFGMQDPDSLYLPSTGIDSADFVLGATSVNTDILIHQIFPHGDHGVAKTVFRVFPIDNPLDYIDVSFKYTAEETVNTQESSLQEIRTSYDASYQQLTIDNPSHLAINYQLIQLNGQLITSGKTNGQRSIQIPLARFDNQIIVVVLESEERMSSRKLYLR